MNDNIFIPGEWYCEYNQDQIKFMRERIFDNLSNKPRINEKKTEICKIFILDIPNQIEKTEDEEDYILGLA